MLIQIAGLPALFLQAGGATPTGFEPLAQYGAAGVLIAGLLVLLRGVLTKYSALIENNTRAITENAAASRELREALRGKIVNCPYADAEERRGHREL